MFEQLYGLHGSDPNGYMDLIRSMRDGSFDKKVMDSTAKVSPETLDIVSKEMLKISN